jgi:hypothetical protein
MPDNCGMPTHAGTWYEMCSGSEWPIWSEPDPSRWRLAVSLVFTELKSDISPTTWPQRPWGVVEIVVPGDRGMIDVAFFDEHIWHFSGAVSCIGKVTVIGERAGVVGLPREKVEFRGDSFGMYASDSKHKDELSSSIKKLLGGEPDVTVVHFRDTVLDLASLLPAGETKGSCSPSQLRPPLQVEADNQVEIDPDQLLFVPTVIPVRLAK